jgi:hypothetical protein
MKKRISVEQIVAVLKQAELCLPVADLIRKVGISEQAFHRWKKQYAGLESDQVREFKQLHEENARQTVKQQPDPVYLEGRTPGCGLLRAYFTSGQPPSDNGR